MGLVNQIFFFLKTPGDLWKGEKKKHQDIKVQYSLFLQIQKAVTIQLKTKHVQSYRNLDIV